MASMSRRPATPPAEPPKHVIEVYSHRERSVTCVCGWQGSSVATPAGSEWGAHVAANRQAPKS